MVRKRQRNSSESIYLFELEENVGIEKPKNTFKIAIVQDRVCKEYPDGKIIRRYFILNDNFFQWVNEDEILSLKNLSKRILDGATR